MVTKCQRAKNKALAKYKEWVNTPAAFEKYIVKQKKFQNVNRETKRNFEETLAKNVKNDTKSFFAYVRSKQRTKDKVGPLKDNMSNIVPENKAAADLLNYYFSTIFIKEDHIIIPGPFMIFKGDNEKDGLISSIITPEIVKIKLQKLNVK